MYVAWRAGTTKIDNIIRTRFLASLDCSKIPTRESIASSAESIPRNRLLVRLNVYKYGLCVNASRIRNLEKWLELRFE
jgi:hypothetical protein